MSNVAERFEKSYIPEPMSGCWLWIKAVKNTGYGRFKLGDRPTSAHRLSWTLHRGEIPDGLWVLHKCDVPSCVNPDHLYLGTHADNTNDALKRGRFFKWNGLRSGENNPRAKLTKDMVSYIRSNPDLTSPFLSSELGVSRTAITNIRQGRTWKEN